MFLIIVCIHPLDAPSSEWALHLGMALCDLVFARASKLPARVVVDGISRELLERVWGNRLFLQL